MMIKSILDTDLYVLTMQQVIMLKHPSLQAKFKFIDRNSIKFPNGFAEKLNLEIKNMEKLALTKNEKSFLTKKCEFFTPMYLDFLYGYRYDSNEAIASQDEDGRLSIDISGFLYRIVMYEVPLLATVSELYFKETGQNVDLYSPELKQRDIDKVRMFEKHNTYYADLGTRRRFSLENHLRVVTNFKENSNHTFVGTSNVHLAHILGIKPLGTMAHLYIMMCSMFGYKMANMVAMDTWVDVYGGELGTFLTDTYTTDVFLKSFNKKQAMLFTGVRHDSGDPYLFVDKILAHYEKLGIDPMTKTIIFSDGLTPKKACEIKEFCVGKIKTSFGLGTNFSNDVDIKPLNIVIKLSELFINDEWIDVVKLSDSKGKHTGSPNEVRLCKQILKID